MAITIEHDIEEELFYFEEDEQQGELKYYLKDGVMDMVHTGVPYEMQGNGYGTELIEAALKYATEKGYKIIPSCPFVEEYIEKNPSARSLVAEG
jgi:predicted GNAT family acetyltransferase